MFLFIDSDNSSDDGEEKIMVERYWKREPSSEFKSRTDTEFYSLTDLNKSIILQFSPQGMRSSIWRGEDNHFSTLEEEGMQGRC